jgi:hypothetical protein
LLGDLYKSRSDDVCLDIKAIERNDKCVGVAGFDNDAIVCLVPDQCGVSRQPTKMMEPIMIAE